MEVKADLLHCSKISAQPASRRSIRLETVNYFNR
jgi:hypothetical protein